VGTKAGKPEPPKPEYQG
jgi:micrococcal nuclease